MYISAGMATFPQIGSKLGRFKLERKLGEGSTGTVFLADDGLLKTKVALRVLNPNLAQGEAFERISREVLLARQISHPGINRVFDLHQEDDLFFVTMEYIEGATLDSVVETCKVIPALQAARLADEVAKALSAAHEKNIIHGGLTMSNIVLREDGQVSVLDFGLSSTRDLAGTTGARAPAETIHYMAPEVLSGKQATVQSDIYSLGVILYRCVTGRYPFQGKHIIQITDAVLEGKVVSPCLFNPDVPPALEKVISMAMAVDLKQRYQTIEGLRKWLAPVIPSAPGAPEKKDDEALSHLLQADIDQGEQEAPAEQREIKTQLIQIRDATILLSDIIGITPYFESHGDIAGRKKIQKHNELLFPVIQRHHGSVIKTIGDAIMAHFESPDDGVEASMEMQQVLEAANKNQADEDDKIRIRVGLHSGRTIFEKQDAFGDAVNVASRISSKAGAGEVLISSSTRDKLTRMRDFTKFHSTTSLKGKTDEYSLFLVSWKEPTDSQAAPAPIEFGEENTEEGSVRTAAAALEAETAGKKAVQTTSSDGPTQVTSMSGTPTPMLGIPVQPSMPPTVIADMPDKFKASPPPVVIDQATELDREPLVVKKRPWALIALGIGIVVGVAAVLVVYLLNKYSGEEPAEDPDKPVVAADLSPSVEELKADPKEPPPKLPPKPPPKPPPPEEVAVVEPEPPKPPPPPPEKIPQANPAEEADKLAKTIRLTMHRSGVIAGDSKKFDSEYSRMKKWQKRSNHSKALLFGKRALSTLKSVRVNKAFVQDKLLRFNRYFDKSSKRLRKRSVLRQLDDLSQKVMAALEAGEYNKANKLLNRSFKIVRANR
jgi:class 3 adenylate cyclase/tRNA A-37 threonylcarbamoyl transferase component Bud32